MQRLLHCCYSVNPAFCLDYKLPTTLNTELATSSRVVSRFLSRRFHPKSRWLFPFYFSNITLRTDLLTFRVTGAVFNIAGEMRRLPAYFDNAEPVISNISNEHGEVVKNDFLHLHDLWFPMFVKLRMSFK